MISPSTADDALRIIGAAGRVVDAYRAGKIVSMPANPDADRVLLDLEASLVRAGMRSMLDRARAASGFPACPYCGHAAHVGPVGTGRCGISDGDCDDPSHPHGYHPCACDGAGGTYSTDVAVP